MGVGHLRRWRFFRPLLLALFVVSPILFWLPGWMVYIPAKIYLAKRGNLREYDRHPANYDAAVLAIAANVTEPGRLCDFSISRDRAPGSLKSGGTEDDFHHATLVRAWRDEKGLLTVMFLTESLGHLGNCWLYCFPSKSPAPRTFKPGEEAVQVGPGWYAVYDGRG